MACSSSQSSGSVSTPETPLLLPSKPHQRNTFSFPKRPFGKKLTGFRSFQASWFSSWTWLHYDDAAFLSKGFSNWKDATVAFRKHQSSECHKRSVALLLTLPATTPNVGEMLCTTLAQEKATNRYCMLKVISCLKFIARQGCTIRGHDDHSDGNFYQLMKLCRDWLAKKTERYIHHECLDELLKLMALNIQRKIAGDLQCTEYFTIMVDECTDISNKEQVVIVFRYVDDDLLVHEEFIGLHEVPSIQATVLVAVIKDTLLRLNLSVSRVRGQCYDGASNMTGIRNGVAKIIRDEEPKALFTHCYGHSLNLAVSDTIKKCTLMKNTLDTTHEITKLVKYSPRRESLFNTIKDEIAPGNTGIRTLCPTRWTVKADTMKSIIKNYSVLQELWDQAISIVHDTATIARIQGIATQMQTYSFFFGLVLGEVLLRHTDNLSRTLQKNYSASEGQLVSEKTKTTLLGLRNETNFDAFWDKVNRMAEDVDVNEPALPRRRKVPRRYEDGNAPAEFAATPKAYYRRIYYEALDLLVQGIESRFDQPGYRMYCCLEELLLKSVKRQDFSEELTTVIEMYGDDLHESNLRTQLQTLSHDVSGNIIDFFDVKAHLQQLTPAQKSLLSEVILLTKLILVMPATNASSE